MSEEEEEEEEEEEGVDKEPLENNDNNINEENIAVRDNGNVSNQTRPAATNKNNYRSFIPINNNIGQIASTHNSQKKS